MRKRRDYAPREQEGGRSAGRDPEEADCQFVTGPMSAEAVNAGSMAFIKTLIERALGAELSQHFGYRRGAEKPEEASNHRYGTGGKTVLTEDGLLPHRPDCEIRSNVCWSDRKRKPISAPTVHPVRWRLEHGAEARSA